MWRIALRREDLMKEDIQLLKHRVVCSDHFGDSAYMCAAERHTTSRLTNNAVPTIFAHANSQKIVKERKPPARRIIQSSLPSASDGIDSDLSATDKPNSKIVCLKRKLVTDNVSHREIQLVNRQSANL
jgi:hypothetical protein